MKIWVNTDILPVSLEVDKIDAGYVYQNQLVTVPVYLSYSSAINNMLTTLETRLVVLKAELDSGVQFLTEE